MKYLKINNKEYFEYEVKDFESTKWYAFTDLGTEGTSRSQAFKTKRDIGLYFGGSFKRGDSKGVYKINRSYVMTGKSAVENGFHEWCYQVEK